MAKLQNVGIIGANTALTVALKRALHRHPECQVRTSGDLDGCTAVIGVGQIPEAVAASGCRTICVVPEDAVEIPKAAATVVRVPEIFGPRGHEAETDSVAQLAQDAAAGSLPAATADAAPELLYADAAAAKILALLDDPAPPRELALAGTVRPLEDVAALLAGFQRRYGECGVIPDLSDPFTRDLFHTYLSYLEIAPRALTPHGDARGIFAELVKQDGGSGQFSWSVTVECGTPRANHYHTRKVERFIVLEGRGRMELRPVAGAGILTLELDGERPSFVDVPPWYVHNLVNLGPGKLISAFWISELFDPADPDTYRENVRE